MKKNTFLLFMVIAGLCFLMSCKTTQGKYKIKSGFVENFKDIIPETVQGMMDAYGILIKEHPEKIIRQINMDGEILKRISSDGDGIRFICGSDKYGTTIIIDVFNKNTKLSKYYDIRQFFVISSHSETMRESPVLCPLPEPCNLEMPNKPVSK